LLKTKHLGILYSISHHLAVENGVNSSLSQDSSQMRKRIVIYQYWKSRILAGIEASTIIILSTERRLNFRR